MEVKRLVEFSLKCEVCGFESEDLDEVCYYDINGYQYLEEPDTNISESTVHTLCEDCAEDFEFET
jgi:hypothetical protein